MGRGRVIFSAVITAGAGLVARPWCAGSRRAAVRRLRAAVLGGRSALGAFSGTPCAAEDHGAPDGGQRGEGTAAVTTGGGDDDG